MTDERTDGTQAETRETQVQVAIDTETPSEGSEAQPTRKRGRDRSNEMWNFLEELREEVGNMKRQQVSTVAEVVEPANQSRALFLVALTN